MNSRFLSSFLVAAALAIAAAAHAQAPAAASASAAQASVPKEFTEGEVRKIDKPGRKITLKHGEIKNLGMPPMAMVFEVKDGKVLDKFKAGDKVRFKAVHDAGKYRVVEIETAK